MPLYVGIQWHPERMHEEADHLALFRLLVEKARR
jgi:gamma-glutamyl-gamma-aminobutyrate hydrolase PuuD